MKPISLTLKGFRGIRDGLGRDVIELDFEQLAGDAKLVAIVGRNGRGKTTIMDNMTPFPIMPSRAGADGLGSFSYYDQVCSAGERQGPRLGAWRGALPVAAGVPAEREEEDRSVPACSARRFMAADATG